MASAANQGDTAGTDPDEVKVRPARDDDASDLLAIYNHEVLTGTATLDLEPRTLATQRTWMQDHRAGYPLIVAELDQAIVGFASLSPFKARAAYRTTAENSIYVAPGLQGRGVGTALLTELLDLARHHGYHSVIARIAGDNRASIALHQRHGYEIVGVEREVGRKFGRWLDVTELQLLL